MSKWFVEFITRLDPDADVYLFGSRVNNELKGGDIDIMHIGSSSLTFKQKVKIIGDFWQLFGEQKVDLVSFSHESKDVFKSLVMQQALKLN